MLQEILYVTALCVLHLGAEGLDLIPVAPANDAAWEISSRIDFPVIFRPNVATMDLVLLCHLDRVKDL
jgi:acyl CoA:acetate/3-ketoacid CoA transferase